MGQWGIILKVNGRRKNYNFMIHIKFKVKSKPVHSIYTNAHKKALYQQLTHKYLAIRNASRLHNRKCVY